MIRINTGAPVPPGADAVVMVEETRLVEATEEGEEVKVEILTKVTLVLLMAVVLILMELSRRWKWVRTSDQWAATSARERLSWAVVLSWDLARSLLLFQANVSTLTLTRLGSLQRWALLRFRLQWHQALLC